MKTIIRFFLSTVAVLVTGCTPEEEHIPAQGGDSFTLSSSEEQAITRAGDVSVNHFTAGTKYRLYGLIGSSWSGRLSTMNGQEGTEVVDADGTHQIEYLSTDTDEDRFEGRILDFYALTYGNTTLPVCGSEADGVPVCNVTSSAGGALPDLRRAVLTGQSGINSGVITLPFKHTLSKLKFEVVKQKPETVQRIRMYCKISGCRVSLSVIIAKERSCFRPENTAIREGKVTVRFWAADSLKL